MHPPGAGHEDVSAPEDGAAPGLSSRGSSPGLPAFAAAGYLYAKSIA